MDRQFETDDYILIQLDLKNNLRNYNYILHCKSSGKTASIDPTFAELISDALKEKGWKLDYILATHHHHDHIGGNEVLKQQTGCTIIGNTHDAERITGIDIALDENETFSVGELKGRAFDVSGHTIGHIAFYFEKHKLLFSGDTVFSMGCGRLFEGTPEQMTVSFAKIMALPEDTLICAAHEYTVDNGKFAQHVEPENVALKERMKEVKQLRAKNIPTVPVPLAKEKETNPFMRLGSSEIKQNLNMPDATTVAIFATLREMKNNF